MRPLLPTDNAYDIPVLDLAQEAQLLEAPVCQWGSVSRASRMRGTWHFYCDDYRFERLWSEPDRLANTGCVAVVEPNFSIYAQTPRAEAIWQIYRKRTLARLWQYRGVRVCVDLNVAKQHHDLALLGVPLGWRSFCTRGHSGRSDDVLADYELALSRHERPLFAVYGGGQEIRRLCERRGWLWLQDDAVHRRLVHEGRA